MIPLPKIIKNFNLYIDFDGDKRCFAGLTEELILPKLIVKTEEFHLGGLDSPIQIDMGLEKLECEFALAEYNASVIRHFNYPRNCTFRFVGAMGSREGEFIPNKKKLPAVQVIIEMTGIIRALDFGNWKASERQSLRGKIEIRAYKYITRNQKKQKTTRIENGEQITEYKYSFEDEKILIDIDIDNFKREINNFDQVKNLKHGFSITGLLPDF